MEGPEVNMRGPAVDRVVCMLALGVFSLLILSCKVTITKTTEAEHHLNEARQLMLEGKWQEALPELDAAIASDPALTEAYANRGTVYGQLGHFDQALGDLGMAIAMSPEEGGFYVNRGQVYSWMGEPEKATADYETAVAIDPEDHVAYMNRGAIQADFYQRFEDAVADYDRAIELDPSFAQAYHNRGKALFALERFEEAITDFDQAIDIGMEPLLIVSAYNERGRTHLALDHYEQALSDFDKAIDADPSQVYVYANRGLVYSKLGEDDKAIADLEYVMTNSADPGLKQQVEPLLQELASQQ
jgi:tetratricopeptide (TPR) repeat protein